MVNHSTSGNDASEPSLPTTPANPWWQAPRLRTESKDGEERHATWLELFFDLVLVAVISRLSQGLKHDLSWGGIFHFVALSIPVWWAWTGITFYATRFDTDDLSDRIFFFLQILGCAALAINVEDGFGATAAGFAISYALLRLLLVLQYILASYFVPEARSLTVRYACGFGLAALCWLASAWLPPQQRYFLWAVGVIIDFSTPLTAGELFLPIIVIFRNATGFLLLLFSERRLWGPLTEFHQGQSGTAFQSPLPL